jgi:hypothetical protein
MGISTTLGGAGRRPDWRRRLAGAGGALASIAVTLALATPAWATASATGTLAPIGSGSYLLTVTNTGSEAITSFAVSAREPSIPTNITPSPACFGNDPTSNSIKCNVTIVPGAMTQVCYTGEALVEPVQGSFGIVWGAGSGTGSFDFDISSSPAVSSCPLPGFTAGSRRHGKGTRPWSHALCESTYNAWTKQHHHATRSQKKAEANVLHKTHGCSLSI